MKHSICIASVYFGKLPVYHPFFIDSCSRNPSVDFVLIGDHWELIKSYLPENCRTIHLTLEEFNKLSTNMLGINIDLVNPYKLCDLKPALGNIFRSIFHEYDFWGYTDIDLILGNIRSFFTRELLDVYDVLFVRKEYATGSLFLIRNCGCCNYLYMNSPDYESVFADAHKYYDFDECAHEWQQLREGISIFDIKTNIVSFTQVVKKMEMEMQLRPYFKNIALEYIPRKQSAVFQNGRIYYNGKEYIIYHFVRNKMSSFFTFPHWNVIPTNYRITPYGVFEIGEQDSPLYVFFHRRSQIIPCWKKRLKRAVDLALQNQLFRHIKSYIQYRFANHT